MNYTSFLLLGVFLLENDLIDVNDGDDLNDSADAVTESEDRPPGSSAENNSTNTLPGNNSKGYSMKCSRLSFFY